MVWDWSRLVRGCTQYPMIPAEFRDQANYYALRAARKNPGILVAGSSAQRAA
jgi:hypothetical protein